MSIQITVKGNLGSDPELKFSKANKAWATFSLAYTPREKKGDEFVDGETMWFRVVSFGEKAELITDTLAKGDSVIVTGAMKQSTFTAKDGTEKTALEITANEIGVVPKAQKRKAEQPAW